MWRTKFTFSVIEMFSNFCEFHFCFNLWFYSPFQNWIVKIWNTYIVGKYRSEIESGNIEFFLNKNGFPNARITLRDWIRQGSIVKYKLGVILKIVETSPHPVLLIGDDTEHDPEVFAHVAKRHPDKVAARYLRVVKGRELPDGSQGFFTAFDIACSELSAGRLENDSVLRIGEAVLRAEKNSRLIPWFSIAPSARTNPLKLEPDSPIATLWKAIQDRILTIPGRKKP